MFVHNLSIAWQAFRPNRDVIADEAAVWAHLLNIISELILVDLAPRLRGIKHLLIIPDGLLRFIPFHALNLGQAEKHPFLIEEIDISYLPSLALARPQTRPFSSAIIILPDYGWGDLQGAVKEARGIRYSALPKSETLAGDKASPKAFLDALSKPQSIVHFAGHGLADLAPQTAPDILFAHGLSVTVTDALKRPVQASLVVLACCQTAYVVRFRDDRYLVTETNLAEALLASGAGAVIAASWSVKDRFSELQMQKFYRHLQANGSVTALNQSYRWAIAHLTPPHPRLWGAVATET